MLNYSRSDPEISNGPRNGGTWLSGEKSTQLRLAAFQLIRSLVPGLPSEERVTVFAEARLALQCEDAELRGESAELLAADPSAFEALLAVSIREAVPAVRMEVYRSLVSIAEGALDSTLRSRLARSLLAAIQENDEPVASLVLRSLGAVAVESNALEIRAALLEVCRSGRSLARRCAAVHGLFALMRRGDLVDTTRKELESLASDSTTPEEVRLECRKLLQLLPP